jgi:hypothetical protein
MWELYCSRLERLAGGGLDGSRCILRCGDNLLQRQAREVLGSLGCQLLGGPLLWLNNTGERLAAFTPLGDIVPYPQLVERACEICFDEGRPVALPRGILPGIENRGEVLRYELRPSGDSQHQQSARQLSAQQLWERDGLMLAVMLLSHQAQGSLDPLPSHKKSRSGLTPGEIWGMS